jgi:hypothetical protein
MDVQHVAESRGQAPALDPRGACGGQLPSTPPYFGWAPRDNGPGEPSVGMRIECSSRTSCSAEVFAREKPSRRPSSRISSAMTRSLGSPSSSSVSARTSGDGALARPRAVPPAESASPLGYPRHFEIGQRDTAHVRDWRPSYLALHASGELEDRATARSRCSRIAAIAVTCDARPSGNVQRDAGDGPSCGRLAPRLALLVRLGYVAATPGYQAIDDAHNYDVDARSIAGGHGFAPIG